MSPDPSTPIDPTDPSEQPADTSSISRRGALRNIGYSAVCLGFGAGAVQVATDAEVEVVGPDEEEFAAITIDDQEVEVGAQTLRVSEFSQSHGGYISLHDFSRFEYADGEDPSEYDVPVPAEREHPICESLYAITDYIEPGSYTDVDVPIYTSDAPAVEFGHYEEGQGMLSSEPVLAIPHINRTDPETFVCPDDPDTSNDPDAFDGAYMDGEMTVETIGAVHDVATIRCGDGSEAAEQAREVAAEATELIRSGVLVPQPAFQ